MREYWEFADRREVAFYVVIGLMLIVGLGMLAARYLGGDEVAVEPTPSPLPDRAGNNRTGHRTAHTDTDPNPGRGNPNTDANSHSDASSH